MISISPGRATLSDRRTARRRGGHTLAQELVLRAAPPRSVRRSMLHLAADNDLAGVKLTGREIDLVAAGGASHEGKTAKATS